MSIKRVYLDESGKLCISCGNCIVIAPEVFEILNKLSLEDKVYLDRFEKIIRLAAFFCPANIIKIEEALIDEL